MRTAHENPMSQWLHERASHRRLCQRPHLGLYHQSTILLHSASDRLRVNVNPTSTTHAQTPATPVLSWLHNRRSHRTCRIQDATVSPFSDTARSSAIEAAVKGVPIEAACANGRLAGFSTNIDSRQYLVRAPSSVKLNSWPLVP